MEAPTAPATNPDVIDEHAMMCLIGAITVQAANDYIRGFDGPGLDPEPFLDEAGILHRASEIVAYAPRGFLAPRGRFGLKAA